MAASLESFPQIEGYRLLQRVGHGGMGEVFEAEQLEPVKRRVAIKVIKQGLATKDVLARFETERQALALMNHSAIAKVFDAGVTADGRPFFAMEFVRGIDITTYCDEQRLTIRERLELFIKVCQGVQHAHHKGVLHRDLKPSNVLVCLEDSTPIPKIIDFGIAKATTLPLTDLTLCTVHGQMIGTPEYMSPEQAGISGLDVDTRTDVYSLGMLLYVLLAGALPFGALRLQAGFDEVIRRIREDEPPLPSTRFNRRHSDETEQCSERRRCEPHELKRVLKGDLDWIVMKALEKDRNLRYETADALAMDVRNHLEHLPVRAARPSALYRLGKLVRRHQLGATIALLMALLIIGSATAMGILAAHAARERNRANLEAATATEVSDFLVDLFEIVDPREGRGDSVTVREVLDAGARQIDSRLGDQPLVRARFLDAIGRAYLGLGLGDTAAPMLEESLALRRELLGADHAETATSLVSLSVLRDLQGNTAEQERLARQALEIREPLYGQDHEKTAECYYQLGWAMLNQDRFAEAEPAFRKALATRQKALGDKHPDVAESLFGLGYLLMRAGRYDEAKPLLMQSVALFEESYGAKHFKLRNAVDSLGELCWTLGRLDEAERHFKRSLQITEQMLGPESRDYGYRLSNLGVLVCSQGRTDEAAAMLERAVRTLAETVGLDHQDYAMALANLAWVRSHQDRLADAKSLYLQALSSYERSVGGAHTRVGTLLQDYAELLAADGNLGEAMQAAQRSLEIRRKALGNDHPRVADSMLVIADILCRRGELENAAQLLAEVVRIRERSFGSEHPETKHARDRYQQVSAQLPAAGSADADDSP